MAQIPENILRRSAEARAKKEGRPVEEILAEMKADSSPSSDSSPSANSSPSEVGAAEGGGGGEAPTAPEPSPTNAEGDGGGQASTAPEPSPDPEPVAATDVSTAALLTAVAAARQMPESLVRRSATARSRTGGGSVHDVLLEWAEDEGVDISSLPAPTPEPPPTPPGSGSQPGQPGAAAGGGRGTTVTPEPSSKPPATIAASMSTAAVAVIENEAAPEVDTSPEGEPDFNGAKSDRLLTVIRAGGVQRIRSAPTDRVTVWPHLLAIEFVALLVVLTLLITISIFLDAPLLEFANFNEQPNPSKAPWYFLGLQELLAYFDPQIAGIIIPTFGAIAIAIIPYIDKNPSVRPSHRKLAIMIFTFFIMAAAVLTIFGSFFRGPGFNFTFPWEDGIFFDDLLSLLE